MEVFRWVKHIIKQLPSIDEDFRFQLIDEEVEELSRSRIEADETASDYTADAPIEKCG